MRRRQRPVKTPARARAVPLMAHARAWSTHPAHAERQEASVCRAVNPLSRVTVAARHATRDPNGVALARLQGPGFRVWPVYRAWGWPVYVINYEAQGWPVYGARVSGFGPFTWPCMVWPFTGPGPWTWPVYGGRAPDPARLPPPPPPTHTHIYPPHPPPPPPPPTPPTP